MSGIPHVIAKLKSNGDVIGPNGEDLLVCDGCGNIWADNGDPHFCCQCGRMFCRMNDATAGTLMMAKLDLMIDEENKTNANV